VEDVKDLCQELAIMNSGQILTKIKPYVAIEGLSDKIWTKAIEPNDLATYQAKYQVLSSGYNEQHQLQIRIYAEAAMGSDFERTSPNLEDVYFFHLLA
ncbi:MAG: ABC transporter ATP-binding protein, partial [Bacteroidota bacterium]